MYSSSNLLGTSIEASFLARFFVFIRLEKTENMDSVEGMDAGGGRLIVIRGWRDYFFLHTDGKDFERRAARMSEARGQLSAISGWRDVDVHCSDLSVQQTRPVFFWHADWDGL